MSLPVFAYNAKPTAAQINALITACDDLNAAYLGTPVEVAQMLHEGSYDIWILRHTHRWLLWDSTGEIVDLAGAEDPVALSDPDSGYGLKDLDEVPWLVYGQLYKVTGCEFAYERREPPGA
jgi:hypothetical protein